MPDSRAIGDNPIGNSSTHVSSKNYLLAIGISEYENFSKLPNGKKDVVDLHKVLTENFDFEPALTKLLTDDTATRENITDELHELSAKLTENDRLLIYYSGHGLMSGESGYWIPKEAKRNKFSDYVSNAVVRDIIKNIKARHILLISDSCFSASLFVRDASRKAEQDISWLDKKASRWVFISGKGEVSDGKPGKNSPFAENIINQLLESKTEDLNIAKIADSVRKVVRYNYEQEAEASPLFQVGHDGGEFVFVRKKDEVALQATKIKLNYEFVKSNPTLHNLNQFLDDFPNSRYEIEIENLLLEVEQNNAFELLQRDPTTSSCRNFIKKYPNSKFLNEVNKLKDEILEGTQIITSNSTKIETPTIVTPKIDTSNRKETSLFLEPEMVFVEGGTFEMGSSDYPIAKHTHNLTLSDFYIGKFPVTQSEWKAIMGNNPSHFKGDNLPVVSVYWVDIQEYFVKLEIKTGKIYRLPTEAEWEYAAKGGNKSKNYKYSGSNDLNEVGWFVENSRKIRDIGILKPNEIGIHDMSGNVWEWCADRVNRKYYTHSTFEESTNGKESVAARGGSFKSSNYHCRVDYPHQNFPSSKNFKYGFRVAMSV